MQCLTSQANVIAKEHGLRQGALRDTTNPADSMSTERAVRWLSAAYQNAYEWRHEESEIMAALEKRIDALETKIQEKAE